MPHSHDYRRLTKTKSTPNLLHGRDKKGALRGLDFEQGQQALMPPPMPGQHAPPQQPPEHHAPVEQHEPPEQQGEPPQEVQHQAPPQNGPQVAAGEKPPLVLAGDAPELAAVRQLVETYNQLPPEATHQQRFAALRAIDRESYQVFKDHPVQDHGQLAFAASLKQLLAQTESAHEDLVADLLQRTRNGEEGHVPIDTTGMEDGDKEEATNLWTSLARGQGDLSVQGSEAFQKKTYGGLAKLMQGKTGRGIVKTLDQRPQVPEGQQAPDRSVLIRESENEPNAGAREETSDMRDVGPGVGEGVDAKGLTRAMIEGQRGVVMGGRQLEFGQGSGVDVDMPSQHRDPRSLDKDNNEVVTPHFIALGHELGHAAKAKTGAKGTNVGFGVLPQGVNPNQWVNSSEEYLNVKGVENPLRREHGMKTRGNYNASVKLQRHTQLGVLVNQCIGEVSTTPAATQLVMQANGLRGNNRLGEDEVYQQVRLQMETLLAQARLVHQQAQAQQQQQQQGGERRGGFRGMLSRAGNFFRHGFRRNRNQDR